MKYRQRYVDLIMNEETLHLRPPGIVASSIRFMTGHGFMEVETPMMHPIPGGASAKPFVTHHNALDMRSSCIAPRSCTKRLVVGGFEKVFEINRNFRNEGLSPRHNPEFTMMEFYEAYANYHTLMDFTEGLLRHAPAKRWAKSSSGPRTRPLQAFPSPDHQPGHPARTPGIHRRQLADPEFLKAKIKHFGDRQAGRPGQPAAAAVRSLRRSPVLGADLHHRLPGRSLAAGPRLRHQPGNHRALRAVHRRPRNRQRLLRAERCGRPGRPLPGTGQGQGRRRRGSHVLRRRLHPRAGIRPAADRWLRHRHRPSDHAADRLPAIRDVILFPSMRPE
jgi:hypothetical protein